MDTDLRGTKKKTHTFKNSASRDGRNRPKIFLRFVSIWQFVHPAAAEALIRKATI